MIAEQIQQGGMLDLDIWDRHAGGIARCWKADCGWEGISTFVRGKPQDWCPKCETPLGDEPDLQAASLPHEIYIKPEGIYEERQGLLFRHGLRRVRVNQGRNEPCACGSGKKFKRCCGA